MTNIIIGDIAEGQKWYGQVEFLKQQLANNHRSNNAFMSTWKQLSSDVKVFIKMVAGKPQAFIYVAGGIVSFGINNFGQLALGDVEDRHVPNTISALQRGILSFSAGYYSSYFVTSEGGLYVVGDNSYGQLGLGDTSPRVTPVLAATGVKKVSAGEYHVLVLTSSGNLFAAGRNQFGQLGIGSLSPSYTFAYVASGVRDITAGGTHSMAIADTGVTYGWGNNVDGRLGTGVFGVYYTLPTESIGVWEKVDTGSHTLFLNAAGEVYACGDNTGYRLGGGLPEHPDYFPTPTLVTNDCIDISAGGSAISAVIKSNNDLYTCGYNNYGELGLGLANGEHRDDYTFVGSGFSKVSTGVWHTLAISTGKSLYSFGRNNYGQLGLGDTADRSIPEKVNGSFSDVSASYLFSLVKK